MATKYVYRNDRPSLAVRCTGGASLGNCHDAMYYEIVSRVRLDAKRIRALWDAGFLGYGQSFMITSTCDGTEEPAGEDIVPCVEEIDGVPQPGPAMNPYMPGVPYEPMSQLYFRYTTEARVDSGD